MNRKRHDQPELLTSFLQISTAVAKVLPVLAQYEMALAKDILSQWAHNGLSLVTNPYAAFWQAKSGNQTLYASPDAGAGTDEILSVLPDNALTPFGESLLMIIEHPDDEDEQKRKTYYAERTEHHRFHVSPKMSAGSIPVVPCVFSLPFVARDNLSNSVLHVLADNDELFDSVFNDTANTEFKSSPGIAVLVDFKWRQFAQREYRTQFYTYLVQYLCFCIFCYGIVFERQFYDALPCDMFSEASVMANWNTTGCVSQVLSFQELFNTTVVTPYFDRQYPDTYVVGTIALYFAMGGVTVFFTLYHLVMMLVQTRTLSAAQCFRTSINGRYLDFATYALMAATVAVWLVRSVHSGAVGAVASVLASWKLLLSWRGFSATSHYIRTILEITKFSYIFLFIMICFSIGCGWAFMLLFGGWRLEHLEELGINTVLAGQYSMFPTFWRTVVTSWDFMVGNTDISTWANSYYELIAVPLFFFFSFIVVLVMLNLVIALMSEGYAGVMETKSKAKIKERAQIIVGIEKTFSPDIIANKNLFPMWVHALCKENPGGTRIGHMGMNFNDQVTKNLSAVLTSLTTLRDERLADSATLTRLAGDRAGDQKLLKELTTAIDTLRAVQSQESIETKTRN